MHLKTTTRGCARKLSFGGTQRLRIRVADALPIPSDESAAPSVHARCTSGNEKAASSFEATGTVQPLNSIQKTVKPLNSSTVKRRRLSWQEENRLFSEIRQLFEQAHGKTETDSEMSGFGPCWRKVCQLFPDELEEAVGEIRYRVQNGGRPRTKMWHWLRYLVRHYVGANKWASAWEKF